MEENTGEKSHNNEFGSDFSNILKACTTKAKIKQTGLYNNNLKNVPNAINTVKREPKCGIQTTHLVNTQNIKVTLISSKNRERKMRILVFLWVCVCINL